MCRLSVRVSVSFISRVVVSRQGRGREGDRKGGKEGGLKKPIYCILGRKRQGKWGDGGGGDKKVDQGFSKIGD